MNEKPSPRSFAELAELPAVEIDEFIASMMKYVLGGWAIDSLTVIDIADKLTLSPLQIGQIGRLAYFGVHQQLDGGRFGNQPQQKDALEYQVVYRYAVERMASAASLN